MTTGIFLKKVKFIAKWKLEKFCFNLFLFRRLKSFYQNADLL